MVVIIIDEWGDVVETRDRSRTTFEKKKKRKQFGTITSFKKRE
jgi:hypothetical protein